VGDGKKKLNVGKETDSGKPTKTGLTKIGLKNGLTKHKKKIETTRSKETTRKVQQKYFPHKFETC
jgi:hypothetical protein